jgi:thioredoxin reductase (NADPH)
LVKKIGINQKTCVPSCQFYLLCNFKIMQSDNLFPKLTQEQIDTISGFGHARKLKKGECIIRTGQRTHDFFVVLEGAIGIYDESNKKKIATHQQGEFTGNIDMLSERASIFKAEADVDSVVLQIDHEHFKELISKTQDLSELLLRAFLSRRVNELEHDLGAVKLIGSRYSTGTFRLREFLSKNHVQHVWVDLEKDSMSESILQRFHIGIEETPIIIINSKNILKNPDIGKVAEVLGISSNITEDVFDVIVVGAGPAGLAASVYASSEGLNVVTIDAIGPGGQAGASSKIENYLGFPMGISGSELANNAYIQAQKFGCTISIPHIAKSLSYKNDAFHLELESGQTLKGSTVIAATGAHYRRLPIENLQDFEGRGVYYGATNMEAQTISGKEIIIVGGGNSAGQAAIFLAKKSSKVHLVIRGDNLQQTMSTYLIHRIKNEPKIEAHSHTEVKELHGNDFLEKVVLENCTTQKRKAYDISDLFLFLGAVPCSEWLSGVTCLDEKGFVYTGEDIPRKALDVYRWPLGRKPQSLEACIPGLFAIGDMRSGSIKRIASAVGEGSMAVSQVHSFLHNKALY